MDCPREHQVWQVMIHRDWSWLMLDPHWYANPKIALHSGCVTIAGLICISQCCLIFVTCTNIARPAQVPSSRAALVHNFARTGLTLHARQQQTYPKQYDKSEANHISSTGWVHPTAGWATSSPGVQSRCLCLTNEKKPRDNWDPG